VKALASHLVGFGLLLVLAGCPVAWKGTYYEALDQPPSTECGGPIFAGCWETRGEDYRIWIGTNGQPLQCWGLVLIIPIPYCDGKWEEYQSDKLIVFMRVEDIHVDKLPSAIELARIALDAEIILEDGARLRPQAARYWEHEAPRYSEKLVEMRFDLDPRTTRRFRFVGPRLVSWKGFQVDVPELEFQRTTGWRTSL